jgi:hypothetical protein
MYWTGIVLYLAVDLINRFQSVHCDMIGENSQSSLVCELAYVFRVRLQITRKVETKYYFLEKKKDLLFHSKDSTYHN